MAQVEHPHATGVVGFVQQVAFDVQVVTNGGVAVVEGRGQERILQILNIEHKRLGERGVVAFVQFVVEIDVFAFLIDPALVRVPPRGVHQVGQHLNVGFVGDIQDVKARVHAATIESRATERDLSSRPWAAVVGHDLSVVHIAGVPLPHKSRHAAGFDKL